MDGISLISTIRCSIHSLAGSACAGISAVRPFIGFAVLIITIPLAANAAPTAVPSFLPSFFLDALKGHGLQYVSEREKNGIELAEYKSTDNAVHLNIEHFSCSGTPCQTVYGQNLRANNEKITPLGGQFKTVSPVEFLVEWREGKRQYRRYVARLPKALVSWTWTYKSDRLFRDQTLMPELQSSINRERFIEATEMDNVTVGSWGEQIQQHARDLLTQGKQEEAMHVLQQIVIWAPNLFEAQLDFAEHTSDKEAARKSALSVWENAEDPALTARAAKLLGIEEVGADSLAAIETGLRGLQVILVPLPPCDVRLIEAAARLYSDNLKVPVRVARSPQPWTWGQEDRIYRERDMQVAIQSKSPHPIDFNGWTRAFYVEKLEAASIKEDALTRFQIRNFLDTLDGKPGQYRVEPYINRLLDMTRPLRSDDRRTMVVGVTEADIFSGENNFLFSGAGVKDGLGAAILSYARMKSGALNEPFQSRTHVAERLAKELVPASLKQLDIPRPTDPTDPYSYSSGTDRLAQKTLTLSSSTREALDKLRGP